MFNEEAPNPDNREVKETLRKIAKASIDDELIGIEAATEAKEAAAKAVGLEPDDYEKAHGRRKVVLPSEDKFEVAYQKKSPWDLGQPEDEEED